MKTITTTLPTAPGFAPAGAGTAIDIRGLSPSSVLVKLSKNLGPTDQATVYGTLDSTAIGTSPNLTLLGSVTGNQGDPSAALFVLGWPYLLIQRTSGAAAGSVFASGSVAPEAPIAPTSVALPGLGAFSAGLNLQSFGFGLGIRIALDKSATAHDSFTVYGTDDSTFIGTAGGQVLGTITGGGGSSGTTLFVNNFQYVYVQRTSGTLGANLLAWGADDFTPMQNGTSVIGAGGVSAAIPANITANSRIFVTVKDFVASTAVGLEATAAGRSTGSPGSFTVTAYDATDTPVAGASGTTFDWLVVG